jgi:biopolymer transport protein ExbD
MRKTVALGLVLIAVVAIRLGGSKHRSNGLHVKVAKVMTCSPDRITGEMVHLLKPGWARVEEKDLTYDQLDRFLNNRLTAKAQRVVFIAAEPGLEFGQVAAAIDVAARYADYVSLITPTVEQEFLSNTTLCLDPNIQFHNTIL